MFWASAVGMQGDLSDVVRASMRQRSSSPSTHVHLPPPKEAELTMSGSDDVLLPAMYPLQALGPAGIWEAGDVGVDHTQMSTAMSPPPPPPPPHVPAIKRRKSEMTKKVVCIPIPKASSSSAAAAAAREVVPSDLWAWRKYGQKPIKGSPYPRGYYRCSSSKGCSARKQVERSRSDPAMLVVTYTSDHNHPWPTHRNALAGSTRSSSSSSAAAAAAFAQALQPPPPPPPVAAASTECLDLKQEDDPDLDLFNALKVNSRQLFDPFSFGFLDWAG